MLAGGYAANANVIHVPADYPTIHAAVNAAGSNDTIQIAAGVYVEQVVITNKPLTLIGAPGAVLRAKLGMVRTLAAYGSSSVPLLGIYGADVAVSGLTFEGERLANGEPGHFYGIYFIGSSGRVEDCRIMGFRGSTLSPGVYSVTGIRVVNRVGSSTGVVNLQVLKCIFADNVSSLELIGDDLSPNLLRTTFAVNDNTITGNGPDTNGVQRGITIHAGVGGEVTRNTIADHSYIGSAGAFPFAQAVLAADVDHFDGITPLAPLPPVRYEGNFFRNNQQHLTVLRGDGSAIVNNSFDGTGQVTRPWGIGISGLSPLISSNRFSNLNTGILLLGNDPDFGTYLGVATNAQVTANQFCNVTANFVVEPLATDTEQGSLGCPAPEPTLDSTRSIFLSWPDYYEGYAVEAAPTANGPWTPSNATLFLQDGRNSVAIPMDSNQQYFRLHHP